MADPFVPDQRGVRFDLISEVGQVLQSARSVEHILHDIVDLVSALMQVDGCSIFLYEDGALKLKVLKGVPEDKLEPVTVELGVGAVGEAALRGRPVSAVIDEQTPSFLRHYCDRPIHSLLCVPMMEDNNLIGVLNLHDHGDRQYSDVEQGFAAFVASQLVGAIRNAQLQEEILRGLRDMATLHRVSQIVSSVLDEDMLLDLITQTTAEHLHARGCALRMLAPMNDQLELRSLFGFDINVAPRKFIAIGRGIAGKVAREMRPFVSNDVEHEESLLGEVGIPIKSSICVPLLVKGRLIGTMGVYDRIEPDTGAIIPFDESDMGLVASIGTQAAMAIENANLFDEARRLSSEKELRIKELSLLLEITNIMRSTLDLEEILYIILTSVTMGQGLGFNRACLFLVDENDTYLQGSMAVGPATAEEAQQSWTAIETHGKSLAELVTEYGRYNMSAGFATDKRIRETRIPLKADKGVVARTALERKSFHVVDYSSPEGSGESVLRDLNFTTFASIPIEAKDNVIGVIVVDNFVTGDPITDDLMDFLRLFSNQAASAIEMARVYQNLEETNKRLVDARDLLVRTKTLATLGEFSAGVAHELRNPLVSIGGFARRLTHMLDADTKEAKYTRIIATEVENLERILSQILEFVSGGRPVRKQTDVLLLLEQVFILFREQMKRAGVTLLTDFEEEARMLWADEVQLRQLFINLIKNSIEAMDETGGTLNVNAIRMHDETGGVGFEVKDTGCGIDEQDLDRIFDPFFSRKTAGTGLGLSMCSRIVESNHGGRIFIESTRGAGTSILVWFPEETVVRQGQVYSDAP
jgi:signal transduction histidine kinase